MSDAMVAAARDLLRRRPDLRFFYQISREEIGGSIGEVTFHSLAEGPEACREAIAQLCAAQREELARLREELRGLPEDERPYDPMLPAGCVAALCIVTADGSRYVQMQSQRWNLAGQSHHPPLIPSIFEVDYYADKVAHGEYSRAWVTALADAPGGA